MNNHTIDAPTSIISSKSNLMITTVFLFSWLLDIILPEYPLLAPLFYSDCDGGWPRPETRSSCGIRRRCVAGSRTDPTCKGATIPLEAYPKLPRLHGATTIATKKKREKGNSGSKGSWIPHTNRRNRNNRCGPGATSVLTLFALEAVDVFLASSNIGRSSKQSWIKPKCPAAVWTFRWRICMWNPFNGLKYLSSINKISECSIDKKNEALRTSSEKSFQKIHQLQRELWEKKNLTVSGQLPTSLQRSKHDCRLKWEQESLRSSQAQAYGEGGRP